MRAARLTAVAIGLLLVAVAPPAEGEHRARPAFEVLANFAPANDFADAGAIAAGPDGSVYVVRRDVAGGQRIDVFTAAGELVRTFGAGQLSSARDVDVDARGGVYVTETERVQKFDATGALVDADWGGRPVESLAAAGERVATIAKNELRRSTPDGAVIVDRPSPSGTLAMDSAGTVYVAGNQGVFVFSPAGARDTIGSLRPLGRSAYHDEFSNAGPTGVAVAPSGDLYFHDLEERRLLHFDVYGSYLATCGRVRFKGQLLPRGMTVTPDGTLLVVDGAVIRRFGPFAIDPREGCLDQYVTLSRRLAFRPAPAPGRAGRLVVRSSVRATATVRIHRLASRGRSRTTRRVHRRVHSLRFGVNGLRIPPLTAGRYEITVDASDAYGNESVRSLATLSVRRQEQRGGRR